MNLRPQGHRSFHVEAAFLGADRSARRARARRVPRAAFRLGAILGRVGRLGSAALGFYKKAYDLFVLSANQLLSPISAVVIGALARSNHDRAQYRRYFMGGLSILALVGMGVGADLTLIGKDMIRFLLGPGWDTAGRIFTYFGPGIGVMLIYSTQTWIHLSIGRADRGAGLDQLADPGNRASHRVGQVPAQPDADPVAGLDPRQAGIHRRY